LDPTLPAVRPRYGPGVLVYGAASLGSAQVIAMASRTGRALRRVVSQTEGSVTVSLCRRGGGE